MYGRIEFLKSPNIGLYILNSFVMTITALTIAYFIGMIVKKTEMVNLIVTPVSLGISFISGVFVELSVLGDTVKKIGRFLPVYWYEDLNDMLSTYSELSKSQLNKVYTNLLLQLLFAWNGIYRRSTCCNKVQERRERKYSAQKNVNDNKKYVEYDKNPINSLFYAIVFIVIKIN